MTRRLAALVTVIVQIARQLGFETVAEGVESPCSLAVLTRLGCDVVQGYFFAKPMPAEECERWLQSFGAPAAG